MSNMWKSALYGWGLSLLGIAVATAQTGNAPLPPPAERAIDFAQDVRPILAAHCGDCHLGDKRKGEFSLNSRKSTLEGGESGPAIAENDSAASRLIQLVAGLDPDVVMPPKGRRLTPEEIGVLRAWIDQGLTWDLTAGATHAGYIAPVSLADVELPPPAHEGENPIDRILRPYFEQHGIARGEPVPDHVYARRVFFDLIGLPPTPAELEAFIADTRPTKRAELVRALLANRQAYADHWMTYWNDALRNDHVGTGYIDGGREHITSWLYQALYDNLPYDQFVTELVNPTDASMGFVKGIVWRGTVAVNDKPEMQAARSIAQVFLGVNLKCASCHDSFTDHWKLADSYGLASVFTNEALEIYRCDIPQGEAAAIKFLWPELGAIDADRPPKGRQAQLAKLVTAEENGHFTRTIVNRLWARFFGRGIVEPLEKIENEPWNADLIDWLARDLITNGYDLKHTMEVMLTSEVYQWPAVNAPAGDEYVFRGPQPRRLTTEQFLDSLASITGYWYENPKFTVPEWVPRGENWADTVRAWRVPADTLMRAMGRPNREQIVLRRQDTPTTLEMLELSNGATFAQRLKKSAANLIETEPKEPAALATAIFTHAVQRPPTEDELTLAKTLIGEPATPEGVEDFLWTITMLPEYQYIY